MHNNRSNRSKMNIPMEPRNMMVDDESLEAGVIFERSVDNDELSTSSWIKLRKYCMREWVPGSSSISNTLKNDRSSLLISLNLRNRLKPRDTALVSRENVVGEVIWIGTNCNYLYQRKPYNEAHEWWCCLCFVCLCVLEVLTRSYHFIRNKTFLFLVHFSLEYMELLWILTFITKY